MVETIVCLYICTVNNWRKGKDSSATVPLDHSVSKETKSPGLLDSADPVESSSPATATAPLLDSLHRFDYATWNRASTRLKAQPWPGSFFLL